MRQGKITKITSKVQEKNYPGNENSKLPDDFREKTLLDAFENC
jgi:hypothetical protein